MPENEAQAAALKLADDWDAEVKRLDALAELKSDPASRAEVSVRAQALHECAVKLREAIAPAPDGEDADDDARSG